MKHNADEERVETVRLSSFVGAMAIGDLVKSTLGPKGMDMILMCMGGPSNVGKWLSINNQIMMTTIFLIPWKDKYSLKQSGKISPSMKDVDQQTGEYLHPTDIKVAGKEGRHRNDDLRMMNPEQNVQSSLLMTD